eukprot:4724872-Prymnesium_polylepis.1
MLVTAGSTQRGASAELWSLNCSSGSPVEWAWTDETQSLVAHGPCPPPRTSHAAAIAGSGTTAALLICGGQDSALGTAAAAILADVWVLAPLGEPERCWHRLSWGGTFPLQRCRHSLAVVRGLAIVYGGYDGVSTIDAHHSLFAAPLDVPGSSASPDDQPAPVASRQQERWAAERPVTEVDLPEETCAQAGASKLPLAMAKALHRFAIAQSPPRDTYIDPGTGYSVFTSHYLKRRPCCGNGCRHCPWGHVNVPETARRRLEAKKLEW